MWFDGAVEEAFAGQVDWVGHDVRVGLLGGSVDPSGAEVTWSQVSRFEVSGAGYTPGGKTLSGRSVARDGRVTRLGAAGVVWDRASLLARFAVVYDASTGVLLGFEDFGSEVASVAGEFRVDWDGPVFEVVL